VNESHEGGAVEFLTNPFRDQDICRMRFASGSSGIAPGAKAGPRVERLLLAGTVAKVAAKNL
jgi:hypothetical protein